MLVWLRRLLDVVTPVYALALIGCLTWYFHCGRTVIGYSVGPIYGPDDGPSLLGMALLTLPWSAIFRVRPLAYPNPDIWMLALEGLANVCLLFLLRQLLFSRSAPASSATL